MGSALMFRLCVLLNVLIADIMFIKYLYRALSLISPEVAVYGRKKERQKR